MRALHGEHGALANGTGTVVVRPEQLVLGHGRALPVREVVFHGPGSTVVVELPDGEHLRVWSGPTGPTAPPAVGDVVEVGVREPVTWLPGAAS